MGPQDLVLRGLAGWGAAEIQSWLAGDLQRGPRGRVWVNSTLSSDEGAGLWGRPGDVGAPGRPGFPPSHGVSQDCLRLAHGCRGLSVGTPRARPPTREPPCLDRPAGGGPHVSLSPAPSGLRSPLALFAPQALGRGANVPGTPSLSLACFQREGGSRGGG